jgi:hypothetical protein
MDAQGDWMMRRTPMARGSGFKRAVYVPPPPAPLTRAIRAATYAGSTTDAVEKECASQSAAYQKAAKALGYCMNCGTRPTPWAPLEFCHADEGKGAGIKTDVRRGWPGCRACHSLLGGHNGGSRMPKAERRALEKGLAARTRAAILAAGTWPKNIDRWEAQQESRRLSQEAPSGAHD